MKSIVSPALMSIFATGVSVEPLNAVHSPALPDRLETTRPRTPSPFSDPCCNEPVTEIVLEYYKEVAAKGGNRWDTSSLIKRLRALD